MPPNSIVLTQDETLLIQMYKDSLPPLLIHFNIEGFFENLALSNPKVPILEAGPSSLPVPAAQTVGMDIDMEETQPGLDSAGKERKMANMVADKKKAMPMSVKEGKW